MMIYFSTHPSEDGFGVWPRKIIVGFELIELVPHEDEYCDSTDNLLIF